MLAVDPPEGISRIPNLKIDIFNQRKSIEAFERTT